jgi:hypothetical protein
MKKTFLIFASLTGLLFLSANLFLGAESKNYLFPYIDTHFSKDFSFDKWDKIRCGATKEEVKKILGEPLAESSEKQSPFRPPCAVYEMHYSGDGAWKYGDFAWQSFDVFLDSNNVVITKSREWMFD